MKELNIIAKTDVGKEALKKHLTESVKLRWDQKAMFKSLGFSQEKVTDEPFTLLLTINNKRLAQHIRPDHFISVIAEALKENGAVQEIDYFVEVQ